MQNEGAGHTRNKEFGVADYLYVVTCLDLPKQLLSTCLSVQFHVMGLLIEMVLFWHSIITYVHFNIVS